jgi:hypothetical protein
MANYHKTGREEIKDVEFVISDEDMKVLINFEHIKDYGEHGFFPVFGGKM